MAGEVGAALVTFPALVTDVDYQFDIAFFDGNVSTPHDFASGDVASLSFVAPGSGIQFSFSTSDASPVISFSAGNIISLRIPDAKAATLRASTYNVELRRIGLDGSIDLLVTGSFQFVAGLSLGGQAPLPQPSNASASVIFTNAVAQVIYTPSAAVIIIPVLGADPSPGPAPKPYFINSGGVWMSCVMFPDGSVARVPSS